MQQTVFSYRSPCVKDFFVFISTFAPKLFLFGTKILRRKSFSLQTLMQLSPFLRCLDCGVCVAIRLVRFGYNSSTGRIALRVAPVLPFPLKREPTVTAWRGTTLGRDINYAISLIVPLRFVRRLRNNKAQSLVLYVKSDARFARRRCGSNSVFEVTQSVTQLFAQ